MQSKDVHRAGTCLGLGAAGGEGRSQAEAWCWPLRAQARGMLLELNECIEILLEVAIWGLDLLHQRHR